MELVKNKQIRIKLAENQTSLIRIVKNKPVRIKPVSELVFKQAVIKSKNF